MYVNLNNCANCALCSVLRNTSVWLTLSVGNQGIFRNMFKIFMKKSRFYEKNVGFLDLMKLFDYYYNIKLNMV
jgi:hypothetical protein